MKPVSHTANLEFSVGRPWEIYPYTHASGIITDIYTKLGDSGAYGGSLILLPDFDAGFRILGASSLKERMTVTLQLIDLLIETMLPALLAQSEIEAEQNFVGTYTTLTLSLNHTGTKPYVVISSFICNGIDVLQAKVLGPKPVRLLPTISDATTRQMAFRSSATRETTSGLFSRQENRLFDWLGADSGTYGGLAVGLFVFDLDEEGKAEAVRPVGWRVKLGKTS